MKQKLTNQPWKADKKRYGKYIKEKDAVIDFNSDFTLDIDPLITILKNPNLLTP